MSRQTPKILILDPIGLRHDASGLGDPREVRDHILSKGARFHPASARGMALEEGRAHFFYLPHLSQAAEITAEAGDGLYDAVIAAATFLPAQTRFDLGGVRIGAGTGNMGSASWGGPDGAGGAAPLMNTPGINAPATAQMAMKALLRHRPDLAVDQLHQAVVTRVFDTGRDLAQFATAKLEGQRMAVLGYGNIGRELAKLGRAFGMEVVIYARPRHRPWIEAEGFIWAETPVAAAQGADVLSVHLGLGPMTDRGFANAGMVDHAVFTALAPKAMVINYDRGELIDIAALDHALASGQLARAAIDADLFIDPQSGAASGPMQPYLALAARHGDKLSLLPHAAADTCHPTRVAGAKQAVDQILDAIQKREIRNLKGSLPDGYRDMGATLPATIGGLDASGLERMRPAMAALRHSLDGLRDAITALEADGADLQGEGVMRHANQLAQHLRALGLEGPWRA